MRYLILLLFLSFLFQPVFGQEKFGVPNMTDNQKHQRAVFVLNYILINGAENAKEKGESIESYAKELAEYGKKSWPKESGFEGFVRGVILNWESWRDSSKPQLKITKQSDDFVQFTVPIAFKEYFRNGDINNISFEELMKMWDISFKLVADHLGATYEQKLIKDGKWVEVTMEKKGA